MGTGRSDDTARKVRRPPPRYRHARGADRRELRVAHRLPVAPTAQVFPAAINRLQLFLRVDALRPARPHEPHAVVLVREHEGREASPTAAIIDT